MVQASHCLCRKEHFLGYFCVTIGEFLEYADSKVYVYCFGQDFEVEQVEVGLLILSCEVRSLLHLEGGVECFV